MESMKEAMARLKAEEKIAAKEEFRKLSECGVFSEEDLKGLDERVVVVVDEEASIKLTQEKGEYSFILKGAGWSPSVVADLTGYDKKQIQSECKAGEIPAVQNTIGWWAIATDAIVELKKRREEYEQRKAH